MHGAQIPDQGTIPTFDPQKQRPMMPSSMEQVVNAIDRQVTFEIGGFPGSPAMMFSLAPGQQAFLPATYCQPIEGANPNTPRPSVLAQIASVEPWPGGPQIQAVVPIRDAAATAARWARAKSEAPQSAIVMLQDTEGRQVPLHVPKARAAPAAAPRRDDDDDHDIEPPPPGVEDLRASAPPAEPPAAPANPGARTVGAPAPEPRKGKG